MLNVIFLLIYGFGAGFLNGAGLFSLLTFHFAVLFVQHIMKKNSVITPLFIYYAGVIIVNIANLVLISKVAAGTNKTYVYIIPKYIDDAAQIWCVSCTAFIMGYNWTKDRALPSIAVEIKKRKILQNLFWILIALNLLTIVGYGVNLRGNQFGKIFGLLNSISILFFARLWAKENNKTYRSYALILFVIETYIALISSFLRFELILPTFYLFAGYFIGKGDIKIIFTYRIIPLLVVIAIYASVFTSLQNNRSNFISVFNEDGTTSQNENSSALLDRSANLAQLTNIVNLVKRNGFYEGRASAPIVTALIPRALWPDKPLIQLGAWFALEIGVAYKGVGGRSNNSINMTVAGELFLDFGWAGVLIGSLLFGAFFAVLWNSTKFYMSANNITGTIFGGYLFVLSIGGYGDLQFAITLLSTYLIFWFIKKMSGSLSL